jgi:omega-6 fatty acid desaturase (delta-12 desaturase)
MLTDGTATLESRSAAQNDAANWRAGVGPYIGPDVTHSVFQLVSTLALVAICFLGQMWALERSVWLTVLLGLPTAGLLVRTFIIMHDCTHGSFFQSRWATELVGYITGLLHFTPFAAWRREHALHHAASGDLDRRGHGDVPTWTVREYLALPRWKRFFVRVVRHPVLFLLGGPLHLLFAQRFRPRSKATGDQQIASVWETNVGIVVFQAVLFFAFGWQGPVVYTVTWYFAAMSGIWLFYVQHQFEDAYWQAHENWDYVDASLHGSSHLKLPALLQWFSGSIGLHHIHHLAPRIPNYKLQACHDANAMFQHAPEVTIRSGLAALRLALWDEERRKLVPFDQVARGQPPVANGQ